MQTAEIILAIESSCDETSAAVLKGAHVASNVISSQLFHTNFGGVVPELASRAHTQIISGVVKQALREADCCIENIHALAVTSEPGLIGSLIVGANYAKGLSLRYDLPIVPVNHIEGHIFSGCLEDDSVEFPFITLVVSGGHTSIFKVNSYSDYEVLGSTRDDAAGEAFDKIAKLLGLGYPGGPIVDKLALKGNLKAVEFPRSMMNESYDFSFSGLKTSVRYYVQKNFPNGVPEDILPDICASAQEAITDVLVKKTIRAARDNDITTIVIAGGVSANSSLRKKITKAAEKIGGCAILPEMNYCVDNAAMIAYVAQKKIEEKGIDSFKNLDFVVRSVPTRAGR
jgi:N6-L-threonylcarbamoyladenine synthase